MRRRRSVPKNSIIQYEELKAAAGGSGSGGGGHGSGAGQVKNFIVRIQPPIADCDATKPHRFRLPKLEPRTKYWAGKIISIGICLALLNLFYHHLPALSRTIVLPLMVYFMWKMFPQHQKGLY
jgi:hypothetical protein